MKTYVMQFFLPSSLRFLIFSRQMSIFSRDNISFLQLLRLERYYIFEVFYIILITTELNMISHYVNINVSLHFYALNTCKPKDIFHKVIHN